MRTSALSLALLLFTLPAVHAQKTPEQSTATFKVSDGLEMSLWAHEPMLVNPTCMDVDHKGRVWMCESVNYRYRLRNEKIRRKEGDRILILEDTQGTGKADKVTVFYQSPDLLAPLGIAVLPHTDGPGCTVYVCQSPDILVFEDKDGDGKADGPPRKLLSGFQGFDHDHGVHGIIIGPDGKLYFTVGDTGVRDLVDKYGRKWSSNGTDCRAGTVWRCDLDGKNLELIAHNFRNHYEPCVDSFGTVFVSDNDDDGNQQTRICYVMPGGNYGYHHNPKVSHWNEEMPGIVPKILRTYFGSPTGICVYEGDLLFAAEIDGNRKKSELLSKELKDRALTLADFEDPKKGPFPPFMETLRQELKAFPQTRLLHTDAGPRHVREYGLTPDGAGYSVRRKDIVESSDNWFRPSDICVAPDGSAFVADWYDPGVGGHAVGDLVKGRIYRLAPKGNKQTQVKVDFASNEGLTAALASPNLSIRAGAITKIQSIGLPKALEVLTPAASQKDNVYLRARALWLMGKLGHLRFVNAAFEDADPRFRILSMRIMADMQNTSPAEYIPHWQRLLYNDPSAAVRREALLLMRRADPSKAADFILGLAGKYDGKDRFYLAAVGIAVGHFDEARRKVILAEFGTHFPNLDEKTAGLMWELKMSFTVLQILDRLNAAKTEKQRTQFADLLASSSDPQALSALLKVLGKEPSAEVRAHILGGLKKLPADRLGKLAKLPELSMAVDQFLKEPKTREDALVLIELTSRTENEKDVLVFALQKDVPISLRVQAVRTLGSYKGGESEAALTFLIDNGESMVVREQAVAALGRRGTKHAEKLLLSSVILGTYPLTLKQSAVAALAGSKSGSESLLTANAGKLLAKELLPDVSRLLRNSPYADIKKKAQAQLPAPPKLDPKNLPSIPALLARKGNVERGRSLMDLTLKNDAACLKCHTINNVGGKVGPELSVIGSKASRENLLESILYPSRAISDQYVTWLVETKAGLNITGVVAEETPDILVLRDANVKEYKIAVKDIETRKKSPLSLMPDNLILHLPEDDLLDIVEYLYSLRSPVLGQPTVSIPGKR